MVEIKVLFVCVVTPFRYGGGAQATTAYLDAALDYFGYNNVDVLVADDISIPDGYEAVNFIKVCKRNKLLGFISLFNGQLGRFARPTYELLQSGEYDICIFNGGREAGWVVKKLSNNDVKFITIHHNHEVEYCMDTKHISTFDGRYDGIVRRLEYDAYKYSNMNLFLTQQDLKTFEKVYGTTNAQNIVVGTFDYKNAGVISLGDSEKNYDIVISGSLKTYQTEHGIKDFMDNYYDIVLKHLPNVRILMTGRDPGKNILEYKITNPDHIEIVASPKDIHNEVRRGNVFLCPTDIGGGLKLRAMDGLKNGLPVLVHAVSSRGYDAFFDKPYFKIYSDKESFEKGLFEILSYISANPDYKRLINHDYYEWFGYKSGTSRFNDAMLTIRTINH